ncbi:Fic family protein [Rhizomonospora bruguierae]|uniref:oxidoreductase n=1 Tax=Rhizomonospora bruguierae TaxID=1581705 RepID=UPI0020BEEE71|nr:oxidoreductase [Micromonospora sp. NBRC 107566]
MASTQHEPLAHLLDLAGVRAAIEAARERVDRAMRDRALRRQGGRVAAEVSLRAAVASAALSGSRYEVDEVRAGTVTDPVVQGALRVAEALPGLVDTWSRAPGQVLARLHVLAARDVVPADALGRPEPGVGERIMAMTALVGRNATTPATTPPGPSATTPATPPGPHATTPAARNATTPARHHATTPASTPPLLTAAVVHGELLASRAFPGPYGVVARAAARLTLMAGGFDPRGLIGMEIGHLAREPEYIGASGAYATGTPDGVRSWLKHCCAAAEVAAEALTDAAAAVG